MDMKELLKEILKERERYYNEIKKEIEKRLGIKIPDPPCSVWINEKDVLFLEQFADLNNVDLKGVGEEHLNRYTQLLHKFFHWLMEGGK